MRNGARNIASFCLVFNKEGKPKATGGSSFADVPETAWYHDAVKWAEIAGITKGDGDGRFVPQAGITRQQLVTMLWRYLGNPKSDADLSGFTDAEEISSYVLEAFRWAVSSGVIQGMGDGRLDPSGTATRAQTAQMLLSLFAED